MGNFFFVHSTPAEHQHAPQRTSLREETCNSNIEEVEEEEEESQTEAEAETEAEELRSLEVSSKKLQDFKESWGGTKKGETCCATVRQNHVSIAP